MTRTQQYEMFQQQVAELCDDLKALNPNAPSLQTRFASLLEEHSELAALVERQCNPIERSGTLHVTEQIQNLLQEMDRQDAQIERANQFCDRVRFFVVSLRSCRYDPDVPMIQEAGEKLLVLAIDCCETAIDKPELCEAICEGSEENSLLFDAWKSQDRSQRKERTEAWHPELKPLRDLMLQFDDVVEAKADSTPHADIPHDDRQSQILDSGKNDAKIVRSEKRPRSRSQRRNMLRRSIGPSLGERSIMETHTELVEVDDCDEPVLETISRSGDVSVDNLIDLTEFEREMRAPVAMASRSELGDTLKATTESIAASPPLASDGIDINDAVGDDKQGEIDSDHSQAVLVAPEKVNSHAWQAMGYGRFSLAYCLLSAANQSCPHPTLMPRSLASVALLSQLVVSKSTEITERLKRDINDLQGHLASSDAPNWSQRLLATSSALRPTLIAPLSDAVALLAENLLPSDVLPSYSNVCRAVGKYGNFRLEVDPAVLTGARELAEWEEQFTEELDALEVWWQSEKCANVIYAHTTNVWHHWLDEKQVIGNVIKDVLNSGKNATSLIDKFVSDWSDARTVDRRCQSTDEEKRKGGSKRRPIQGRAIQALRQKTETLRDMLSALNQKIEIMPGSSHDFEHGKVMECRNSVLASIDLAIHEMQEFRRGGTHAIDVKASLGNAETNLQEIKLLFTQPRLMRSPSESVAELLTAELALAPGVNYTFESDSVEAKFQSDGVNCLIDAVESPLTHEDAFQMQTDNHNHAATEHLLAVMESSGTPAETIERLTKQRSEAFERDGIRLKLKAYQVEQEVDKAVCYDLVNEAERQSYVAQVTEIGNLAEREANLSRLFDRLTRVERQLSKLHQARLEEVKSRYNELQRDSNSYPQGDLEKISTTLDAGDFATADEYISLVRTGEHLDSVQHVRTEIFNEFFLGFLPRISEFVSINPTQRLQDWIEQLQHESPKAYEMPFDTKNHQKAAADLLDLWRLLLRVRKADDKRSKHLRGFFERLGFGEVKVEHRRHGDQWSLDLVSGPTVANAKICVIPQFGSSASGRYQVVSIDGKASDSDIEKILSDLSLDRQGSEAPLIVLYCGRLDQTRRRRVAEECWGKYLFLLVDEFLVMFLAAQTEGLQQAFFQSTLPFTSAFGTALQHYGIVRTYRNVLWTSRRI